MKGLFIPEITAEMFRNGCLEGIEALMAEGEIYDIDYTGWIPCSKRLPKAEYGESDCVLTTCCWKSDTTTRWIEKLYFNGGNWCYPTGECFTHKVIAWKPLPEPYREDGE